MHWRLISICRSRCKDDQVIHLLLEVMGLVRQDLVDVALLDENTLPNVNVLLDDDQLG